MSEPSDGDGSEKPPKAPDPVVEREIDVPSTRKQDAVKASEALKEDEEPPKRPSSFELDAPPTYPDDGPISAGIRKLDKYVGTAELLTLLAILAAMVVFVAVNTITVRLLDFQIHMKEEIVHGGTFTMAMIGAAYAAQQARHLAMDLVSRRLSARGRLVLKVLLGLFTIMVLLIVVRAGYVNATLKKEDSAAVLFTPTSIAWTIPIGASIVILHVILHMIIDIDYLVRGKTPPERMRSGH